MCRIRHTAVRRVAHAVEGAGRRRRAEADRRPPADANGGVPHRRDTLEPRPVSPYPPLMRIFLLSGVSVFAVVLALALLLSVSGRLGGLGRAVAGAVVRTPGLDVVVSLFTWVPWVAMGLAFG